MAQTLNLGTNGNWARKKGSLLAYNSENNNYKPLPFTFERDSVATRVNKQGLIETVGADQPRIDYLNDSNGALLLEPSRTNLIQYSSDISQSFNTQDITETQNYGVAPNGNNESTRLQLTSSTSHYWKNYSLTNGSQYTASFYYKGIKGQTTYMRALPTGGGSGNIKLITFNGNWQREELTFTAGSSVNYIYITDNRVGADNTATDFEVWGAQLEQASYATSYIPTQGSAVTRLADSCSNGGNEQVFNDSEGTFFVNFAADFNIYGSGLTDRGISINNGTNTNSARIFQATSLNNRIAYDLDTSSGTNQVFNTSTTFADITNFNKVAFTYKQNEFKIFLNGVQQGSTDTSGSVFSDGTLKGISFDYGQDGNKPFFGRVKEVKYFNSALSDQELAALTQV